ncbi:MAG: hypothetical protein OXI61_16400 [Candidatus Poribacteria bacterium]|nr:hypothetical protein [Candidatus Poribacteria bacterium]
MFNSVFRRISLGVLLLMVGTVPALIASDEIKWEKTLEDSLTKAEKTGKPMMMDFYTDW